MNTQNTTRGEAARALADQIIELGYHVSWDTRYSERAEEVFEARGVIANAIALLPDAERRATRAAILPALDALETRLEEMADTWHKSHAPMPDKAAGDPPLAHRARRKDGVDRRSADRTMPLTDQMRRATDSIGRGTRVETAEEPTTPALGFAETGSSNSLIHLGIIEEYQTNAVCGVGIVSPLGEYRPSRERLDAKLCPRCKRAALLDGVDPYEIGYRVAVDGQ